MNGGDVSFLADGGPAAGRLVVWRRKGYAISATCDAEGKFRLEGLPGDRGQQEIFFVEDANRAAVKSIRVAAPKGGGAATARFGGPVAETARVVFHVTMGGKPLAGVVPTVSAGGMFASETDAEGSATIGGLPPGAVPNVMVMLGDGRVSDNFKGKLSGLAPLAAGETRRIELELPGGAVKVRVLDASGASTAGAAVLARPAEKVAIGTQGWSLSLGDGRFADDAGTALLTGLPAGVTLEVSAYDTVLGRQAKTTVVAGTMDAPAEVTLTLAKP